MDILSGTSRCEHLNFADSSGGLRETRTPFNTGNSTPCRFDVCICPLWLYIVQLYSSVCLYTYVPVSQQMLFEWIQWWG